jgi:hypothetical protein
MYSQKIYGQRIARVGGGGGGDGGGSYTIHTGMHLTSNDGHLFRYLLYPCLCSIDLSNLGEKKKKKKKKKKAATPSSTKPRPLTPPPPSQP